MIYSALTDFIVVVLGKLLQAIQVFKRWYHCVFRYKLLKLCVFELILRLAWLFGLRSLNIN